jgi:hypothetical protein
MYVIAQLASLIEALPLPLSITLKVLLVWVAFRVLRGVVHVAINIAVVVVVIALLFAWMPGLVQSGASGDLSVIGQRLWSPRFIERGEVDCPRGRLSPRSSGVAKCEPLGTGNDTFGLWVWSDRL